jgi:hypothetical protein
MSERRMFVPLETQEREALKALAAREKRNPRAQAAWIIRDYLQAHGLLQDTPNQVARDGTREGA